MPTDERVLVIPTSRFQAAGYFHGFRSADDHYRFQLLTPAEYQFRPRSEVETDSSFKQLIPYVVIRFENDLFHYRRGSSGTEKRLQSLRSVGIGGHICEQDAAPPAPPGTAYARLDAYETGMRRELFEEVSIECRWKERFLGFINDDRTPVGSVHLGVVHLFDLQAPRVQPREAAIAAAGFSPLTKLVAEAAEFETWSQFVLSYLQSNG